MSYLLQSKRRERRYGLAFILIGLFLTLSTLSYFLAPTLFGNMLHFAATPLWRAGNYVRDNVGNPFEFFSSRQLLVEENRELKEYAVEVGTRMALLEVIARENEELKKLLGREVKDERILASVLSRPPQSPYDTLVIDVGENHGVRVGDKVIATGSMLVGEIAEVYSRTAKVILFSETGRETEAFVDRGSIPATVIGKGAGNLEMELHRDVDTARGDAVVSPGLNHLIFGFIEKIEFKPTDSSQRVWLKNPINILHLRWVEVQVVSE